MENPLRASLLELCRVLNQHEVQYMLVGGAAVAMHGHYRHSVGRDGAIAEKPDLDCWYNPSYHNYYRVLNALETLGLDVSQFREEQAPNPRKSFFKKEFEHYTLDLLPEIKAPFRFSTVYERRVVAEIDGVEIPHLNLDDLIGDKESAGRPKDQMDIEQLKQLRKEA